MTWMTPLLATMSVFDDLGVVHHDAAVARDDRDRVAADRLRRAHLHDVRRHDLAGHDVIREDAPQLRLVLGLQQVLDRAGRQLGERLVGRREHRERPRALERLDQTGGLERLRQRLERSGRDGRVDDVLRLSSDGGGMRRGQRSASAAVPMTSRLQHCLLHRCAVLLMLPCAGTVPTS